MKLMTAFLALMLFGAFTFLPGCVERVHDDRWHHDHPDWDHDHHDDHDWDHHHDHD
jgi:hypothetical protein